MSSYLKNFSDNYKNERNIDLYCDWIDNNAPYYKRYYTLLALAITSLLIPFDFLLYDSPELYLSTRALLISLYIIQLCIIFKIGSTPKKSMIYPMILIPSASYNITYSIFLMKADPSEQYYLLLLLATFFVVIISHLFIYKFYKEQYGLLIISISCLFIASIYNTSISQDILKLIFFHLICLCICIYYRYQFMLFIINKYDHLSSLLPNKYAKLLSVSDQNLDINTIFPTQEYYAVCLCSDWRDYQKISNTTKREKVEKMLEKFYTIIYKELDKSNLNGQYYADWTADELFIIFYGNNDEKEKVRREALNFTHSLATSIYMDITAKVDKGIMYDIGLSSGNGLIGLQGPKNYKKTSITGDVAGNSKRFETQAKEIRKSSTSNLFPIIVMDEKLSKTADELNIYSNLKKKNITGTVKDILDFKLNYRVFLK